MAVGWRDKAVSVMSTMMHGRSTTEGAPGALDECPLVALDGTPLVSETWRGRLVLFVNVASRCGLTPQYAGLRSLYHRYREQGFVVIGVPCNQFLGQEPGSPSEIATFCSTKYGIDFPLLEKQEVNGPNRSPLYRWLVEQSGNPGEIAWNFEKFLVSPAGRVIARFGPRTEPAAPEVVAAIEAALG